MKLYGSVTSPYVRKARIIMAERGIDAEFVVIDPMADANPNPNPNPLGKIPTLELAGGELLFDSRVICQYLDRVGAGAPLLPREIEPRFAQLKREALADGILDAAVANVYEARREPEQQSAFWLERRADQIRTSVAHIADLDVFQSLEPSYGDLMLGGALDYLNFRHADMELDRAYPELFSRLDALLTRESFISTAPPRA